MSTLALVVLGVCIIGACGVGSLPGDSSGERLDQDSMVKRGGGGPFRPRQRNPFQYLRRLIGQFHQLQYIYDICDSALTLARQANQTTSTIQTSATTPTVPTTPTPDDSEEPEESEDRRDATETDTADFALHLTVPGSLVKGRKRQLPLNRFTVWRYINIYYAQVRRLWRMWRRCARDLADLTPPQVETTPASTTEGDTTPTTTEEETTPTTTEEDTTPTTTGCVECSK